MGATASRGHLTGQLPLNSKDRWGWQHSTWPASQTAFYFCLTHLLRWGHFSSFQLSLPGNSMDVFAPPRDPGTGFWEVSEVCENNVLVVVSNVRILRKSHFYPHLLFSKTGPSIPRVAWSDRTPSPSDIYSILNILILSCHLGDGAMLSSWLDKLPTHFGASFSSLILCFLEWLWSSLIDLTDSVFSSSHPWASELQDGI